MTNEQAVERGLPRAYLRPVLLSLVANGPAHGYDLLVQARAAGIRVADPGGLYRTLRAMEYDNLLESWWEDSSSGPPRRTYMLTASGRRALRVELDALRETVELLSALLDRDDEVAGRLR
jgi:PadR family transcriptional regulator PadR